MGSSVDTISGFAGLQKQAAVSERGDAELLVNTSEVSSRTTRAIALLCSAPDYISTQNYGFDKLRS